MFKNTFLPISFILIMITVDFPYARSRLAIPDPDFDFGYVPQHAKVSHVFWLHSTGDDTLKITNIIAGCGCTKIPLKKAELAAGDSAELEVIYSTRTYRGRQTRHPSIMTNMEPKKFQVSFTAEVVPNPEETYPIIISPYTFDISQFNEKERENLNFTITNVSEEDLEISLIDIAPNMFKVKLPRKIRVGKTEKGKIEILDEYRDHEFEKSMTIELSDKAKSRFTIPIKRKIRVSGAQTNN
ncbi:MAG: DUF1573 domain-containing protein [Candidatus Zixiibacteriota bacterium]|nr:MAG: DUF1573 domain-containing protein [candidate division Zixibacteria bacterium]